jgi:hypothetical protein
LRRVLRAVALGRKANYYYRGAAKAEQS